MLDRMAGRADLLVDLKAALQRRPVVGAEDAVERPLLVRQRGVSWARAAERRQRRDQQRQRGGSDERFSISGLRQRRLGAAKSSATARSTAAPMLVGSGRGRSSLPISGNRIRKWKK